MAARPRRRSNAMRLILTAVTVIVLCAAPATASDSLSTLYHFGGPPRDGASPSGGLLIDSAGVIYGTTQFAGKYCDGRHGFFGCGTVYRLTPDKGTYVEKVLHSFGGRADGSGPNGGLVEDASGALYGTTFWGGASGQGTVFKLTPSHHEYAESVLHSFGGTGDGASPGSGLVIGPDGALYGTTEGGGLYSCLNGSSCGTVFKLTPGNSGYTESVLYAFQGGTDGYSPSSALTLDASGNIFGVTGGGGGNGCGGDGCGVVFELSPSGATYAETILYHFLGNPNDGSAPDSPLIEDSSGVLYGTTYNGGPYEMGTIFSLTPGSNGYVENVLYGFTLNYIGTSDGANPVGPLVLASSGTLYGATYNGGNGVAACGFWRCGIVYSLVPSNGAYAENILYNFEDNGDGYYPSGGLTADASGNLYGSTREDVRLCTPDCGTIFRLKK